MGSSACSPLVRHSVLCDCMWLACGGLRRAVQLCSSLCLAVENSNARHALDSFRVHRAGHRKNFKSLSLKGVAIRVPFIFGIRFPDVQLLLPLSRRVQVKAPADCVRKPPAKNANVIGEREPFVYFNAQRQCSLPQKRDALFLRPLSLCHGLKNTACFVYIRAYIQTYIQTYNLFLTINRRSCVNLGVAQCLLRSQQNHWGRGLQHQCEYSH